jgi:hypothetical protein
MKNTYSMHEFQYNNADQPVICDSWHLMKYVIHLHGRQMLPGDEIWAI